MPSVKKSLFGHYVTCPEVNYNITTVCFEKLGKNSLLTTYYGKVLLVYFRPT